MTITTTTTTIITTTCRGGVRLATSQMPISRARPASWRQGGVARSRLLLMSGGSHLPVELDDPPRQRHLHRGCDVGNVLVPRRTSRRTSTSSTCSHASSHTTRGHSRRAVLGRRLRARLLAAERRRAVRARWRVAAASERWHRACWGRAGESAFVARGVGAAASPPASNRFYPGIPGYL